VVEEGVWRMSRNYPEWTKSQLMLLFLWNKLQEAYDQGESELNLLIVRGGDQAGVQVGNPHQVNVSDEIPELSRGGEAVAVFDRLWREGYIHVGFGDGSPTNTITTPALYSFSTAGLIDIGKFPDPDERMARAFEEARDLVANDSGIPPDKKTEALDTMSKMIGLFNNVAGLGEWVTRALGPHGGGS
jgi:hypothetical protein